MRLLAYTAALARLQAGDPSARITKIGFGTSGVAPLETDTVLTDAYIRPLAGVQVSDKDPRAIRFTWLLTENEAISMQIREVGLYTDDDVLVVRMVRPSAIEKSGDMTLGDYIDV